MIPVEQTILTIPDGNCLEACIASILEIPLETIPHFRGCSWVNQYNEWIAQFGLSIRNISLGGEPDDTQRPVQMPGFTILSTESLRHEGKLHAVVCYDGVVVYDPHPQREEGVGAWVNVLLFIVRDASVLAGKLRPLQETVGSIASQKQTRPIRYSELKPGTILVVTDDAFTCLNEGQVVEVVADGDYCVVCSHGLHSLFGQVLSDTDDTLVGLELVKERKETL